MTEKLSILFGSRTFFWISLIIFVGGMKSGNGANQDLSGEVLRNIFILQSFSVVFLCICSGLRAKQIDKSGWLWATMFIPIINLYYIFVLGFTESKKRIKN